MDPLRPCLACSRHVRASERACPFCGAALPERVERALVARGRLGRAAIFAFRASSALALSTLTACGDDAPPGAPPITAPPEETIMQPYGAPPEPRPEPTPLEPVPEPTLAPPVEPTPEVAPTPEPPAHSRPHSHAQPTTTEHTPGGPASGYGGPPAGGL